MKHSSLCLIYYMNNCGNINTWNKVQLIAYSDFLGYLHSPLSLICLSFFMLSALEVNFHRKGARHYSECKMMVPVQRKV